MQQEINEAAARRAADSDSGNVAAPVPADLRSLIEGADDREYRDVHVKAWGFPVRLQTMSGTERDAFENSVRGNGKTPRNLDNIRARLLVKVIVGPDNKRIFADSKEDVERLGSKSAAALSQLFDVAAEMNGLTARDVKKLEGNSDETDGD